MGNRRRFAAAWIARLACLLPLLAPLCSQAQADPPGRVGRLADLQGHVWRYDPDPGEWVAAELNRPLTSGDRLATDGDARATLQVGSTTLRLGPGSELELQRVDDEHLGLRLDHGALALRVRSREIAAETEVVTEEVRLQPLRNGHYRVDRIDDSTHAGSWRGTLRVGDGAEAFEVDAGQRVEVWREGARGLLQRQAEAMPRDAFESWVVAADADDQRRAASRYLPPEMTGAEDLDRYGRWEQAPGLGPVWVPDAVDADWAPYREGHWAWVAPWGWTWVDDAAWGFAPFHYGRWLRLRGRWCWAPGDARRRPVFAPALVAWIGGPGFALSIGTGGPPQPAVGWVPLAPREPFVPYFRASRDYEDRVNHRPRGSAPPARPPSYANQSVPGAVTWVPRESVERQRPVGRGRIEAPTLGRAGPPERGAVPVPPPVRAQPVAPPSRAVPPPPSVHEGWRRPPPLPAETTTTTSPRPVESGPAIRPQEPGERRDERRDDRRDDGRDERRDEHRDERRDDRSEGRAGEAREPGPAPLPARPPGPAARPVAPTAPAFVPPVPTREPPAAARRAPAPEPAAPGARAQPPVPQRPAPERSPEAERPGARSADLPRWLPRPAQGPLPAPVASPAPARAAVEPRPMPAPAAPEARHPPREGHPPEARGADRAAPARPVPAVPAPPAPAPAARPAAAPAEPAGDERHRRIPEPAEAPNGRR